MTLSYAIELAKRIHVPEECLKAQEEAAARLIASGAEAILQKADQVYEDTNFDTKAVVPLMEEAAEVSDVHVYTVWGLFLQLAAERAEKKFQALGISEQVFLDTFEDLKYKLVECLKVKGVWGNFEGPDAQDICCVIGAGTIGLSAAMSCAAAGATVFVVDPIEQRRETALKYGADYVLDPTACNVAEEVRRITGTDGATLLVECSGSDAGIQSCFDIAAPSARISAVGHSHDRMVPIRWEDFIWKTLMVKGSAGTRNWFPRTIRFMSKIKDRFDFDGLVSNRFAFDDILEAFQYTIDNKATTQKVMLMIDDK